MVSRSRGVTRRDAARTLAGALALALCPGAARGRNRGATATAARRGPRKVVQICLKGGSDVLYSVDPKEAVDVRPGIGPVYRADDLLVEGNRRFAPAWAPLREYLPRMQVINGVQSSTVAHPTGLIQVEQLRRDIISPQDEAAVALLGRHLAPEAPVSCLYLDLRGRQSMPEGDRLVADGAGGPLLTELHRVANDDSLLESALEGLVAVRRANTRQAGPVTAVEHVLQTLRHKPLPAVRRLDSDDKDWPAWMTPEQAARYEETWAMQFEWALFALQHDLSPTVYLTAYPAWDSHSENHAIQSTHSKHFAIRLNEFLRRLGTIDNGEGTALLDDVAVILFSGELGRFPYVNHQKGKDHFPQISVVLMGPGVRPGTFGETDREMVGRDVSLRAGKPGRGGTPVTLDDIGRTVLEWIGIRAAEQLGYRGRVLEFCLA